MEAGSGANEPQRGSEAPARTPAQIRGHLVAEQASRITRHPELKARRRGCQAVPRAVADVVAACVPVPAVAAGEALGAADLLGAPRRALAAGAGWLHQIDHLSHLCLPGGRLLAWTGLRQARPFNFVVGAGGTRPRVAY